MRHFHNHIKLLLLCCGIFLTSFFWLAHDAHSAGDAKHPPDKIWSFEGMFGSYDKAALQRGFQVYEKVCSTCHAMEHLYYRDLKKLGYSDEEVKAIAAQHMVTDGPDDTGEMFERPAKPSDRFASPYKNDAQARYLNNGALPPDLSLIVNARHGGADYIHALLTGYKDAPESINIREGLYYNPYFPGKQLAMAPPLVVKDQVEYADGTTASIEQMSKDVTYFLQWASNPHMESRKRLGLATCLFLIVFSGLMYGVKKKIWKDLH